MPPDPCRPDVDPETAALWADLAEIAQERDRYAAEAADLRTALAAAHTRETFLHDTITGLRDALAAAGADPGADLAAAARLALAA